MLLWCSYSKLTEEEIKLDRYAKFRALGQFEEHLVPGGQWRETRASRAKVPLLLHALSCLSYRRDTPVVRFGKGTTLT